MKAFEIVPFSLFALAASAALAQDAAPGRIGLGAPRDIMLEVSAGDDGAIMLSNDRFELELGGYYRLNLVCADDGAYSFTADDLIKNAHLRILSVGTIEAYLQGMSFRALECDGAGSVRFSFHPMRPGEFAFTIRNADAGFVPEMNSGADQLAQGVFVVE